MNRKFKTGDKVRLISDESQTPMTVNSYFEDNPEFPFVDRPDFFRDEVQCDWRDSNGKPYREQFKEDQLVKVE